MLHEGIDGVHRREHDPVECPGGSTCRVEWAIVLRYSDTDGGHLDRIRAKVEKTVDELSRLVARAGHQYALPEERSGIEPPKMLAETDDRTNDEHGRVWALCLAYDRLNLQQRTLQRALVG